MSATLTAKLSHAASFAWGGGDWDHLVFGRQRMTLVTLKGILRHRLPLNEAWPPAPIIPHSEFGSPLNVDDGSASEECASASASIFAPRACAGSDIKRKPRKGSAGLVILGETRKVSYPSKATDEVIEVIGNIPARQPRQLGSNGWGGRTYSSR